MRQLSSFFINPFICLVNEKLNTGSYEVEWNGSDYLSGVYFYRMEIHSNKIEENLFTDVKRMVLIK